MVVVLCLKFFFQEIYLRIQHLMHIDIRKIALLFAFILATGLLYCLIVLLGLKFNLVIQKSILIEASGLKDIFLLFVFALVVATVEEIVFRGADLSYWLMRFKPWISILIISVVFSVGHIQYSGLLPHISLFLFGIVTSFLVIKTNTLYLAIGLHCGWNFANSIFSLYFVLDNMTLPHWGSMFELLEMGILTLILFSVFMHSRSRLFLKMATKPDEIST